MIKSHCFNKDWFQAMSAKHKYNDLGIIEKVVRAYSLLDMLARSGCPFVFKGGTCCSLILGEKTRRLSIDIDIVCPPGTNIEDYLNKVTDFGFTRTELVERRQAGKNIPKSHSKFFYQIAYTDRANNENYILLDVLYEDLHYNLIEKHPVNNPFIEIEGNDIAVVNTPSIGDILGDKLTAFAPNTTGIPYYKNGDSKSTEIMKQVYDIGRLFDAVENLDITTKSFDRIALVELRYRNLEDNPALIFDDIRQAALLLATRGKDGSGDFPLLQDGIKRLGAFIYQNKYYIEDAIVDSAKAAYIATCIEKRITDIVKYSADAVTEEQSIGKVLSTKLNKLKKSNQEAFFYWWMTDRIL